MMDSLEKETFKDIPGYERLYQVSNFGNVKSLRNGENSLKLRKSKNGYLRVKFKLNNIEKLYYVHRLVGQTFIANPDNLPEINHKDEVKTNNKVENLEWCTRKYNVNYGTRNARCRLRVSSGVGSVHRKIVCITTNEIFKSISAAATKYKVDRSSIIQCCKGKRKSAGSLNGQKLQWQHIL